jgi:uncharacterized protein (TIGR02145 family)
MKYFSDILSEVFTWCHTVVAAPTELILTADCPNFILNWTSNSTNETGFVIQRSDDGNNWNNLDTVGAGVYTYTDTTGTPDILYYYRVYAFNATEISGYSNVESINCDFTDIKYGLLYNWFVATDARNIANTGWHVPTSADIQTLIISAGGEVIGGCHIKEVGAIHWDIANTGDNSTGFTAVGAGYRSSTDGSFLFLNGLGGFFSSEDTPVGVILLFEIEAFSDNIGIVYSTGEESTDIIWKKTGLSIRLIKNDSTDPLSYTGNDGKLYSTVKIGSQVWLSQNLAETRYRDGSVIPEEQNDAAWEALATGAWCYYDNDPNNM